MAKRRVGVEYSPSMLEPVSPGAVSPDRALCLPTLSHCVIVNKTFLSLSLARDCKKASTTTFCCRRQSIMWQERASRVSGTSHCTNWQGLLYLSPRHLHRASNPAAIRRSPPTTARASGGEPCTFLETLRFFLTEVCADQRKKKSNLLSRKSRINKAKGVAGPSRLCTRSARGASGGVVGGDHPQARNQGRAKKIVSE